MKKEEPKPEEGKEVSTFNLSAMMTTNIVNANDSTVFNNEKTGTSRRISKG